MHNCEHPLLNERGALVGVFPWDLIAVAPSPHLPVVMKVHPEVGWDVRNTTVHQVVTKAFSFQL